MKQIPEPQRPTAFVVFGGTGDLAQTKLLPALLDLFVQGALPKLFTIIGLSRKELTHEEYQQFVHESIARKGHTHPDSVVKDFCAHVRYVQGSFDDRNAYARIIEELTYFDETIHMCTNKLFYLAVPPALYGDIFTHVAESNALALCDEKDSWARLLVEKPFGKDLTSAQALDAQLRSLFSDEQVYRIDHYLAKDAIEDIIALRFTNGVLMHSWNNDAIESIHIRLFETKTVSNRGAFYDAIGTLRDVGQNHLLQILALLTMGSVDVHDAAAVRRARATALSELLTHLPDTIVRGQYEGYADTPGVAHGSETETYFKLGFSATGEHWRGTRFELEAGKAMREALSEAVVTFRSTDTCHCSYASEPHTHQNVLRIVFSPEQKISFSIWVKKPGFTFTLEERELVLLNTHATDTYSPEAYERVLYDCIVGDQTRFVSGEEVEIAWKFITPIMEQFSSVPLIRYPEGSETVGEGQL